MKTPGQIAHDAYHQAHRDGPFDWKFVRESDKRAWEAAARAVQIDFIKKMLEGAQEFQEQQLKEFRDRNPEVGYYPRQ